jgi:hypothetical protein
MFVVQTAGSISIAAYHSPRIDVETIKETLLVTVADLLEQIQDDKLELSCNLWCVETHILNDAIRSVSPLWYGCTKSV